MQRGQVAEHATPGTELAVRDVDMRDDRSVISVDWPGDAVPGSPVERPADEGPLPKRRAAAYAAQHPDRDDEERPLTDNERRALRRASNQLCSMRVPTTDKDPSAMMIDSMHPCSCLVVLLQIMPTAICETQRQAASNANWREMMIHGAPAFPTNVFICPQREEIQLTARLSKVTPAEFFVAPPNAFEDDEQ